MLFAVAIAFATVAMVWTLRDGKTNVSNRRLVLAWIAGVVALNSAAVIILPEEPPPELDDAYDPDETFHFDGTPEDPADKILKSRP